MKRFAVRTGTILRRGSSATRADPPSDLSPQPIGPRREYSWRQSIGLLGVLTLVAGTLVILASCGLLIFLWRGAEAAKMRQEAEFWKTIATRGWAPQVVTICSAAIRTSMVLQLGLLVAALASIILETSGAFFGDIPVLSTERASKSSPISILPAVLRRTTSGFSGVLHSFIIVTAVIVMFSSTFISTILLSDFRTTRIAAPAVTNNASLAFILRGEYSGGFNGASYWKSKPSAQWQFAEAQIGERRHGDTGDTYRAMIPFNNETSRTSLEHYSGPAIVANSRTICTPLRLDTFSIIPKNKTVHTLSDASYALLYGARLRVGKEGSPDTYDCQLFMPSNSWGQDLSSWPLSLCLSIPGVIVELPDAVSDLILDQFYAFRQVVVLNSTTRISFGPESIYDGSHVKAVIPERLKNLTSNARGLWTTAYDSEGSEVMKATVCYLNEFRPQRFNVIMSGETIESEPIFDPKENEDILLQLGAGTHEEDFAKRGILKLDIGSHLGDINEKITNKALLPTDPYFDGVLNELPSASKSGWSLMRKPYTGYTLSNRNDWSAHIAHASVFQSIMQETRDPAIAIQALGTRMYQMTYYDWLGNYDRKAPVTTVHSTERLIPARWIGLMSVLVLIGVHLGLVFTTIALFFLQTRASALGNAWQTVAQVAHTTEALDSVGSMLDKEVEKWIKATGQDKEVYTVLRSEKGTGVEIRRVNSNRES